tara:strand:- start:1153 stop:1263 length:111 start_codon:yes stop_codon:yes gene_type:complete
MLFDKGRVVSVTISSTNRLGFSEFETLDSSDVFGAI